MSLLWLKQSSDSKSSCFHQVYVEGFAFVVAVAAQLGGGFPEGFLEGFRRFGGFSGSFLSDSFFGRFTEHYL